MDLSIILCTWNRAESLSEALASIDACVVPGDIEWEVLIVDNNSSDETRAACEFFVRKAPGRFRYLFERQQGKSFALNAAIQQAKGKIVGFTDDDLTVDPHWVKELVEAFRNEDCAGVGGKIVPVWSCPQPSWLEFDGPYVHSAFGGIVRFDHGESVCELNTAPIGANMAYRREILEKYGPFRPDLCRVGNLLGGEDSEYGRRLLKGKERLLYAPKAVVYHPVEEKRTKRKYFRSWAYHYGRWLIRIDGIPEGTVRYFGIPRFLMPIAMDYLIRWLAALNGKRRLYYQLLLWQTVGEMIEARSLAQRVLVKPASGLDALK